MTTLSHTSKTTMRVGWPSWRRSLWYHWAFYAKTWRASVISTFLFPILYLTSMGLGVGHLVNKHTGLVQGQTYLHFVAPGLVAITAMQMAAGETMWPILGAVKWVRTYHAAAATPLSPEDIVTGKLSWVSIRLFTMAVVYAVIILFFGALTSWWSLALPFVAVLTGLAFGAPLMAFSLRMESDVPFTTIYRFIIVPMFLFSATFYPLREYPGALRPLVQFMPLYHGVALSRSFAFGNVPVLATLAHIAVLLALGVIGIVLARQSMRKRLVF
jgi:lipooligosaccharide transport system permease protein